MKNIFKNLAPRGWRDVLWKLGTTIVLIAALNIAFVYLSFEGQKPTFLYLAMQGAAVGGPFALMSFIISYHQVQVLRRLSLLSRKDGLTGSITVQRFWI